MKTHARVKGRREYERTVLAELARFRYPPQDLVVTSQIADHELTVAKRGPQIPQAYKDHCYVGSTNNNRVYA